MSAERKIENRKAASSDVKREREPRRRAPPGPKTTPESATSLEKDRLDDDAVEQALLVTDPPSGLHSVLPCPSIPPNEQKKARESMVSDDETPRARKPSRKKHRPAPG